MSEIEQQCRSGRGDAPETRHKRQVLSIVTAVDIESVKRDINFYFSKHFTVSEVRELSARHPRTTAGFLAIKEALREVFRTQSAFAGLKLADVELTHDESGAPKLRFANPLNLKGESGNKALTCLSVSIAHTRSRAYGMVTFAGAHGESERETGLEQDYEADGNDTPPHTQAQR